MAGSVPKVTSRRLGNVTTGFLVSSTPCSSRERVSWSLAGARGNRHSLRISQTGPKRRKRRPIETFFCLLLLRLLRPLSSRIVLSTKGPFSLPRMKFAIFHEKRSFFTAIYRASPTPIELPVIRHFPNTWDEIIAFFFFNLIHTAPSCVRTLWSSEF